VGSGWPFFIAGLSSSIEAQGFSPVKKLAVDRRRTLLPVGPSAQVKDRSGSLTTRVGDRRATLSALQNPQKPQHPLASLHRRVFCTCEHRRKNHPLLFSPKISTMQIRFFAPNNPNPVEVIQADVIPPVGSLIRFPNGVIVVATQIRLDLPPPGQTLQMIDVMVQQQ